jgi:ATP-binding cassette subfamily F protein uup
VSLTSRHLELTGQAQAGVGACRLEVAARLEGEHHAKIEATITTAEARVAELEATLSDPAVFKERAAEVPALVAALDAARAEVVRLYDRWSELDAIAAASPS